MDGPPPLSFPALILLRFNFCHAIHDHRTERTNTSSQSKVEQKNSNQTRNTRLDCIFDLRAIYVIPATKTLERITLRSSLFLFCTKGDTFSVLAIFETNRLFGTIGYASTQTLG
jgi:hypothetical protein